MTFKRVVVFFGVLISVSIASYLAIRFARGERFDFQDRSLKATGLLVASSLPDGASVFIDGKLKTATDDTINLAPGEYKVEIKKDGFHPWQKYLQVEKELVTNAEVHLFSTFPSLTSLTYTGAAEPVLSPDGDKVAFTVATASASKRGIWVLDISGRVFGLNRQPRQIIKSATGGRDFALGELKWSPDSKQLLVTLKDRPGLLLNQLVDENFILEADRLNEPTDLIDISPNLDSILSQWDKEAQLRQNAQLSKLPDELLKSLDQAIANLQFSPDEKKIMYTATASATIPDEIIPPLPASNTQPETRRLEPGKIYVYDLIEDKNFLITSEDQIQHSLTWFPTSQHLFLVQNNKVVILEYDNTNWTDVYTGAFENGYAFPFPAADKILILASLGEGQPPNLYAVSLR